MYLGMRVANLIFARAWLFHLAQWAGRIGAKMVTRKDGWIHSLPSVGAKWTQTRDLRGLPKQTFHEWWKSREQGSEGAREQESRAGVAQ
jgi:L-lactate dehydrogenase complex protein LldF